MKKDPGSGNITDNTYISLNELCGMLSVTSASGRNWIKLSKITPAFTRNNAPFFSADYAEKLAKELTSGINPALKSRRNKKYISGSSLYRSYLSETSRNSGMIRRALGFFENPGTEPDDKMIRLLLADCFLHLWADKHDLSFRNQNGLAAGFLQGEISIGEKDALIRDLIEDTEEALELCERFPGLFETRYFYEENEDVPGLLYLSLKNIRDRKASGSYYTPVPAVKKLIRHLPVTEKSRILDPACGTGIFLLHLPKTVNIRNIFGNDTDSTAVKVTRLNLALKYEDADTRTLYRNITGYDFLSTDRLKGFDIIMGNPPWGSEFSAPYRLQLKQRYKTAAERSIESCDVFTEQALRCLSPGGCLSFILPEAVLTVRSHLPLRKIIAESSSIRHLEYLGNIFDRVQCPSVIMQIEHTGHSMCALGMHVDTGTRSFRIRTEREISPETFCFMSDDNEYLVLQKLLNIPGAFSLSGNADFAMGIVTGDNKKLLSKSKDKNNEPVLKGSDIKRFRIGSPENHIVFHRESFQQAAPEEFYRAPEKLLYRFICDQPVFAYDNKQMLTLNSCNIVIPRIKSLDIKYIMAVLNSSVSRFIFKKQFSSVKVLRSYLEKIPLPQASRAEQNKIIEMTEKLCAVGNSGGAYELYDKLDEMIFDLFGLSVSERVILKQALMDQNLFLE